MRALASADIHLKLWPDKDFDSRGLPMKLIEILDAIKQMADYATENNIDTIFLAGDINDTKGVVAVRPFVLFRELIQSYPNITWYILHGNHDATTGQDMQEHSAIQLFDDILNAQIITEVSHVEFGDRNVLFVPNSKNIVEILSNEIESLEEDTILVSHFGVNEAQLSSGISIKTSIRASDLSAFPLVILGHYHSPQLVESGDTRIYYTGSPVPVRRDEAHEEKRFLEIDLETLDVASHPITGYRRYIELILDEDTDIEEFQEEIAMHKENGHHVIVRKKIAEIPLDIKSIVEETQVIEMYEKDITNRGLNSSMSDIEQADKYLDIMEIPEDEREEYMEICREIMSN